MIVYCLKFFLIFQLRKATSFLVNHDGNHLFPTYNYDTKHVKLANLLSASIQSFDENDNTKKNEKLSKYLSKLDLHDGEDSRRTVLKKAFLGIATSLAIASTTPKESSAAYEAQFPQNLEYDGVADLSKVRKERIEQKKHLQEEKKKLFQSKNDEDIISDEVFSYNSFIWGGALWLLSGSRSSPLITPIGNLLYDKEEEEWLKDRNEGLFSSLPNDYYFILFVIFIIFGCFTDVIVRAITEDGTISLQVACTSFISGGALELGRIFSGEKRVTREFLNNEIQLQDQFQEFASNRLKCGGNCHRSEVVKAFRRYYAQYRQDDDLSDLEIERVFRLWCQKTMNINMSSAGFFSGVSINQDADVFVTRT